MPGTMGTPAAWASSRAVCLRPKEEMLDGLGPTKARLLEATARAKEAFSLRKP